MSAQGLIMTVLLAAATLAGPVGATAPAPTGPQTAGTAELKPFDARSMAAIRAAQRGRPFVLVLWSVTCIPCREELPHWAHWQRAYPGVEIVLVATDPPADAGLIRQALAGSGMPTRTWAFADDYLERLRWTIDPAWHGEVPRTYLFDAAHVAQGQSGRIDPAKIERWLTAQAALERGARR